MTENRLPGRGTVPTRRAPNGHNWSIRTIETARALRAAGWGYGRIAHFLDVPKSTVIYWTCARHRRSNRHAAALSYQRRRVLQLADVGLDSAAIWKLLRSTCQQPPTTHQINQWLREDAGSADVEAA